MDALEVTQFGFYVFFGATTFVISLVTLFVLTRKNPPPREDYKEKQ